MSCAHGLARILQEIDDAARRILEENVPSVGQQVIFGSGPHGFDQPFAEFPLQKADDPTNLLQRESTFAQLADHGHFGQIVERIDAIVSFAYWNHDAALVPPLELARADSRELHYCAGCKSLLHREKIPET